MINRGIPTKYGETTFRSRLEARWAVLLDELELKWEYEPFDANGYIPDFVIVGPHPVIVEVKPYVTVKQMYAETERLDRALQDVWDNDILIVGSTPFPDGEDFGWKDAESFFLPAAGLIGERMGPWEFEEPGLSKLIQEFDAEGWCWGNATWNRCVECGVTGWIQSGGSWRNRPCDHYSSSEGLGTPNSEQMKHAFERARDATKWHGK